MHDEVSETENIRKNLSIERHIVGGCEELLDVKQVFIRQGLCPFLSPGQRVETRKREMFSEKSVRRFVGDSSAFVMIRHGRHVVSQCPKQKHFPPVLVNIFQYFRGVNASV